MYLWHALVCVRLRSDLLLFDGVALWLRRDNQESKKLIRIVVETGDSRSFFITLKRRLR